MLFPDRKPVSHWRVSVAGRENTKLGSSTADPTSCILIFLGYPLSASPRSINRAEIIPFASALRNGLICILVAPLPRIKRDIDANLQKSSSFLQANTSPLCRVSVARSCCSCSTVSRHARRVLLSCSTSQIMICSRRIIY